MSETGPGERLYLMMRTTMTTHSRQPKNAKRVKVDFTAMTTTTVALALPARWYEQQ